ncbi:AraC family transcriptional regulator, partial [Paraburkholderia sp. Se-20369]|nr:AraC family transcriptional regulator [Paraburkholderia sp. Se-20369]
MEPIASPAIALRRYDASEASDVHDFHQVVLGLDGAMVMAVDGVGQRIDRHGAWLIPAGSRHDYAGLGENRQLVLDLPASSLAVPQRLFDGARALSIDPRLSALVAQVAAGAARFDATPGDAQRAAAHRFHWQAAAQLCGALLGHNGLAAPAAGPAFARTDQWLGARPAGRALCRSLA